MMLKGEVDYCNCTISKNQTYEKCNKNARNNFKQVN